MELRILRVIEIVKISLVLPFLSTKINNDGLSQKGIMQNCKKGLIKLVLTK